MIGADSKPIRRGSHEEGKKLPSGMAIVAGQSGGEREEVTVSGERERERERDARVDQM
ncbi:MAG: hypothetical protein ABJD11_02540 [Gemmatimonadota bacterium]